MRRFFAESEEGPKPVAAESPEPDTTLQPGKVISVASMTIDSPIGPLCITVEGAKVSSVEFGRGQTGTRGSEDDERVLSRAVEEIRRYFGGDLTSFTVPVGLAGPSFHRRVWDVLSSIPFGGTMTYAGIAERLGSPKAARAVGNACAKNPVPIIVPCHRVLAQGGLGGFGGGLEAKRWLLRHEGTGLPRAGR